MSTHAYWRKSCYWVGQKLRNRVRLSSLIKVSLLAVILNLIASACQPVPVSTPTPAGTATPQPTSTETPTPSLTPTPTLTPEPAWYQPPDPSLGKLKYSYALVTDSRARVYVSLEAAAAKTGDFGYLPDYPAYVAYTSSEVRNGQTYYLIAYGWTDVVPYGWMDGSTLQLLTPSTFSGLLPTREVTFRFGWVLADTHSIDSAGNPIRTYRHYQVIHEVPAAGERPGFVAVGPDEWLPQENVSLISSNLPPDVEPGFLPGTTTTLVGPRLMAFEMRFSLGTTKIVSSD